MRGCKCRQQGAIAEPTRAFPARGRQSRCVPKGQHLSMISRRQSNRRRSARRQVLVDTAMRRQPDCIGTSHTVILSAISRH